MEDKIEILPVTLLESQKSTVADLKHLAGKLKLEFGWHYLLDLTWIIDQLEDIEGKKIIDAGAGTGIMQWYLANNGAKVFSVDRESRADLPGRFRRRFPVEGLREEDLVPEKSLVESMTRENSRSFKEIASELVDILQSPANRGSFQREGDELGQVIIYNQDLRDLEDFSDASVDAIVAVSSLEHNTPEGLEEVINELMRVLRPGCALFATLGAARDKDWFHSPSNGWCYSEGTLRTIFNISPKIESNYDQYDRLFESLRDNNELQGSLASFYFQSGDNGMPWGKWNPQYQPVGICKVKQETLVGEQYSKD